jgi:hypothetical protein
VGPCPVFSRASEWREKKEKEIKKGRTGVWKYQQHREQVVVGSSKAPGATSTTRGRRKKKKNYKKRKN